MGYVYGRPVGRRRRFRGSLTPKEKAIYKAGIRKGQRKRF